MVLESEAFRKEGKTWLDSLWGRYPCSFVFFNPNRSLDLGEIVRCVMQQASRLAGGVAGYVEAQRGAGCGKSPLARTFPEGYDRACYRLPCTGIPLAKAIPKGYGRF